MNNETLARATFVLDRRTAEQLAYISGRLGVSRSELVRSVLAEPVETMAGMIGRVPENPSESDLRQLALDGLDAFEQATAPSVSLLRQASGRKAS
jgi:hypothetical protein